MTSPNRPAFDPHTVRSFGPYEVVRYVDEGGMAWVYEARDPRFPARRLALKVLKPQAGQGELFHRFVAEAKLLAGVDHPNLVTIFDLARDEATGLAYYTMGFVEGATLARKGPMPWLDAVKAFLGILDGLAELHDRGVIHRDIKPGNMLVHKDGRSLLADLGIARDPESVGLTRVGSVMGTPAYMPPEQAAGQAVDARADLFAIGMSIFRVVTGRTVYETVADVDPRSSQSILSHLAGRSTRREELEFPFPEEVPLPLREFVQRACRFDPDARFESAREMRALLSEIIESQAGSQGAEAPDPEAVTRAARTPRRVLDPENVETIGGYEIVGFIAEGGMGWVFEARSKDAPDERLALKALKPGIGSEEELTRFRAEAELLAGIDHVNLVGVRASGVDSETGTSFYTMPYIDSPPLSERGRVPVPEALRIVDGVLTALSELHRRGIVHRDVKPANILVEENGTPILTDLGIARQTNQQTLTSTGMFLGTALYASPEQARGGKVGPSSDVFSVGLLLYRLLSGTSAYSSIPDVDFQNDTSILFHLAKLEHSGEQLGFEMPKDVPLAVAALIERACRYQPDERFADAVAMRTQVRQIRRDPTQRVVRPSRWPRVLAQVAALAGAGVAMAQVDWTSVATRFEEWSGEGGSVASDSIEPTLATGSTRATNPESTLTEVGMDEPVPAGNAMALRRLDGATPTPDGQAGRRPDDLFEGGLDLDVRDPIDATSTATPNRNPRVGIVPARRTLEVEMGAQRTFAARVSDPDGDRVSVEYWLDGERVAQGTRFVFNADRAGNFRIQVRAIDERGGVTEVERFVRVPGVLNASADFDFDDFPAGLDPDSSDSRPFEETMRRGDGGGGSDLPPVPGAGPASPGPGASNMGPPPSGSSAPRGRNGGRRGGRPGRR